MSGDGPLVSILMPAYNERAHLSRCLERVLAAPLPEGLRREIVLVDDASTDGTSQLADEWARHHPDIIRVFHQSRNQGKGAAIRRAIAEMRGDYAIFQDADLEYDPRDYPAVLAPLLDGRADVVYGSRFAARAERRILNYYHELGNRILTTISNLCTGLNLTDMETCYKAFRADLLRSIPIRSDRFGIEPEITAKVARRRAIVYEVPIRYHGRSYEEGKKIGLRDAFSALWIMLKYRFVDDCYSESVRARVRNEIAYARRFHRTLARLIRPFLGQRILEIQSGLGALSRLLPCREQLTLTETDPECLRLLRDEFRDREGVDVIALDPESDADWTRLPGVPYDTVVAINVLQILRDDAAFVKRVAAVLSPGGRFIFWAPLYPRLYGSYDAALGHHRRYRARDLLNLLRSAGFDVEFARRFNFLAVIGWWVNSRLLRRRMPGRGMVALLNLTFPLTSRLERHLVVPGLNLLAVARKGSHLKI